MEKKIRVFSNSNSPVVVVIPGLLNERHWRGKGSSVTMDKEVFEEALYDAGFKYMIDNKILYTEDLEVLKEVGLEDEDATEITKMKILTDDQKKRMLTVMPMHEFKAALKELSREEINDLVDYAITNKIVNLDKCGVLKEKCGRDIMKILALTED